MNKPKTTLYFQKRYSLLLHSVNIQQKVVIASIGDHSGHKIAVEKPCTYHLNQILDVSCIDVVEDGVTHSDSHPAISVVGYEVNGKRMEIGGARFDMSLQKIIRPESTVMYAKELENGKGTLSYKFVSIKTRTLNPEEYEGLRKSKKMIEVQLLRDELSQQLKHLKKMINDKDSLISRLEERIEEFLIENTRLKQDLKFERQTSKVNKFNLSVQANPVEDRLRIEIQNLKTMLQDEMENNQKLEENVDELNEEKEYLEQALRQKQRGTRLKSSNQMLRSGSSYKPSGRASKIAKNSLQSQDRVDKASRKKRRNSFIEGSFELSRVEETNEPSKRKGSIRIEDTALKSSIYVPKQEHQHANMLSSNVLELPGTPATPTIGIIEPGFQMRASQAFQGTHSQAFEGNPNQGSGSLSKVQEMTLSRKINQGKEELKYASQLIEKQQEIALFQKKCKHYELQNKQLEKELDRCHEQMKKKDIEIREIKRKSKKNLLLDMSGRDLSSPRSKNQIEQRFEKIQAQYESQRVEAEKLNDKLEADLKSKNKEVKEYKKNYTDLDFRYKAMEQKFKHLKITSKKNAESVVQFKQKAAHLQAMGQRNRELEHDIKGLKEKLAMVEEQKEKLLAQNNKMVAGNREMQKQNQKLKKLQREHDFLKSQNNAFKQSIDHYQTKYNDLKKYCLKIEGAYSKFMTSKRSGAKSVNLEEQKQIQEKFVKLSQMVNECELSYFQQQIDGLMDEKSFMSSYYDKKMKEEKEKLSEKLKDKKDLSEDEKRSMLQEKQELLEKEKKYKLSAIQGKVTSLEKSMMEAAKSQSSGDHLARSHPDQVKFVEAKVSNLMQREGKLKNTINELREELRLAKSGANNPNQLKVSNSSGGGQNQLLQSMIAQNRQRKTMLEEARLKSEQTQMKAYEQNRKMNTNLMRENHELKGNFSKLKMESERAERKAQERQKNMQTVFKKSEFEYKLKIDKLTEQNQKLTNQIEELKDSCDDKQNSIEQLTIQIKNISDENTSKDIEIGALNEKIEGLEEAIRECERAERKMRDDVEEIKTRAELNQKQFISLMERRSEDFLRIEHIRQTEIQKLKTSLGLLEQSLESQMYQNMKMVSSNEQLKEQTQKLEKELQSKVQNYELIIQNKKTEADDLYMKEFMGSKENQSLKTTLMEVSSQIQQKELTNAELNLKLDSLSKQLFIYECQEKQFQTIESKLKQTIEIEKGNVKDKAYQLRLFQQKFTRIQSEIELTSREMERLTKLTSRYEETIANWQAKYNDKQEEIIELKKEISMKEIEQEKKDFHYSAIGQQSDKLQIKIQELELENTQLQETLKTTNLEKEQLQQNTRINSVSKLSKKASLAVMQDEPLSPLRKSKSPKRMATIDAPLNQLGFGGITPINPDSVSTFPKPKLMDSLDLNEKAEYQMLKIQKKESAKDETFIQINVEEEIEVNQGNKKAPEDDIRVSNAISLVGTNLGMRNFIREETEETDEHKVPGGRNIDLAEDSPEEEEDANQEQQKLQEQIIRLEDQNKMLKEQLVFANQQIQKLHQEISELEAKATLSDAKGSRSRQSRQILSPNEPLSPQLPRRSRAETSRQSSKEITLNEPPSAFRHRRNRSGSGDDYAGINMSELQKKLSILELQLQELKDTNSELTNELNQNMQANEKLIQELNESNQTLQNVSDQMEEARFEAEQYKKYQVFQEYYMKEVEKVKELTVQIEEVAAQTIDKENRIADLLKENSEIMDQVSLTRDEVFGKEEEKEKIQKIVAELRGRIEKMKVEYRKYEESAEAQIYHLREQVDELKGQSEQKDYDKIQLGNQYLQLENQISRLNEEVNIAREKLSKKGQDTSREHEKVAKLENQVSVVEDKRQSLLKTVKKLEQELMEKSELIKNMSGDASLAIKKYEIKLQTKQEEMMGYQQKIAEKEKIIGQLKNEIALYNEQTQVLRKSNDAMSFEIQKVERELKDIMQVYGKEIQDLNKAMKNKDKLVADAAVQLKQKETKIELMIKQIRSAQRQKDQHRVQALEIKQELDKVKRANVRELTDVNSRYQFKVDQCEKIKMVMEKVNQELAEKQAQIQSVTNRYEKRVQGYKISFEKYQIGISDLQDELKKVESRPTIEAHEQVLFENQLLRNEIDDVRQQLARNNSRSKEEQIYSQFRKYKKSREQQIQDLQGQMEKYGSKIAELEENVFSLRRDNEQLREVNVGLQEEREEMRGECEDLRDNVVDLEKELHFYKKRKIFDMQKMLNDTH